MGPDVEVTNGMDNKEIKYSTANVMQIQITDKRVTQDMLKPQHIGDAGIDLVACIAKQVTISHGASLKIDTGIKAAIPNGWVGILLPRSGTGSKGTHLANVVGVIDSQYRGPVIANIKNNTLDNSTLVINPLDRIVQMLVISHYDYSKLEFTDNLDETERGANGFGSTGT